MTHVYSVSEFKNIDSKEYNLSLVKTDRNGTQYFEGVQKCWKCGGSGVISYFYYYSQGVCFACNGSGTNPCKVKVMTDEHFQKLEDKRIAKQNKAIEERKAQAEKSSYFGNVGDKVDGLEVTFKNEFFYETQFGGMCIYIFEDADGHQFKWNTSTGFSTSLVKEDVIKIKGTIKEHSEYNGIKQTVLTRCKLVA